MENIDQNCELLLTTRQIKWLNWLAMFDFFYRYVLSYIIWAPNNLLFGNQLDIVFSLSLSLRSYLSLANFRICGRF